MGFNYIPVEEVERKEATRAARSAEAQSLTNSTEIEKLTANLDYVAMMADIELEVEDNG